MYPKHSSGDLTMKRKNDFNKQLIATIDNVLRETFGEPGLLIYSWLKVQSVQPEEIPEKLDAFAESLKTFSAGGSVVERMILRKLYSSYGLEFEQTNENYGFTDHITELRNFIRH
jgi:hypothetical protein